MINGFNETCNSAKSKKNILSELNEQPDTWYCPECGWTGTIEEQKKEDK